MADQHTAGAYTTIASVTGSATTSTSITLTTGAGTLFPKGFFNAIVVPAGVIPTLANGAETVRAFIGQGGGANGDVATIIRAQEGSSAVSIVAGDAFWCDVGTKVFTDAESEYPKSFGPLNYIEPGDCVWTADSAGSTLNASLNHVHTTTNNANSGTAISALSGYNTGFTLTVVSTTGFDTAGVLCYQASGGTALVYYTGTTATTFTGCVLIGGWATGSAGSAGAWTAASTVSGWTLSTTAPSNQVSSIGHIWIKGKRLQVPAIFNQPFTASKDTYVDLQDNTDTFASFTYTSVANCATAGSPNLPNSDTTGAATVRCAIITTGGTFIYNASSINQGNPQSAAQGLGLSSSPSPTTVAALSNGNAINNTTLNVASNSGYGSGGGLVSVVASGGTAILYYTGTGSNTLTGCTVVYGNSAWTVSTGNAVNGMSQVFTAADSQGFRIYPTNPAGGVLGVRVVPNGATYSTTSASLVQVPGLILPVQIPTGRTVRVSLNFGALYGSSTSAPAGRITQGGLSTLLAGGNGSIVTGEYFPLFNASTVINAGSGQQTFQAGFDIASGTASLSGTTGTPYGYLVAELV